MSNWIKQVSVQQWIINVCMMILSLVLGISIGIFIWGSLNKTELVASEQWGGAVPMKIYTVFDRDTGVYYAITEKGINFKGENSFYNLNSKIWLSNHFQKL